MLESVNWNQVFVQDDVNIAYNKFNIIITNAFNESFPLKPLPRKRAKDKLWITTALKTSSRIKNSVYRKWMQIKNSLDWNRYKSYRNIFKKVALEAENLYYKELFDTKTNSIKKL